MWTISSPTPRGLNILDVPAPAGSVLGTAFDRALETNPIPLFMFERELEAARGRGPRLPKDIADQQAKAAGVSLEIPEDGITQPALSLLIRRKQDKNATDLLYARAENSLSMNAGIFAATLAGTLADPLNIAAGMLPVYGPSRYARLLGQASGVASRAGVRLGVGALEGAVGAGLVEVPTYLLRQELQDDYTLYDSMTNIAFGTLASAGLRGVAGGARDALLGIRVARQQDIARGIASDVLQRMRLEAANAQERQFWTDLESGFARGEGISPDMIKGWMTERWQEYFLPSQVGPTGVEERFLESGRMAKEIADSKEDISRAIDEAVKERINKMLGMADESIERRVSRMREDLMAKGIEPTEGLVRALYPDTNTGMLLSQAGLGQKIIDDLTKKERAELTAQIRQLFAEGKGLIQIPRSSADIIAAISDRTHETALRTAIGQAATGQRVNVDAVLRTDPVFGNQRATAKDVVNAAKSNAAPENIPGLDLTGVKDADAIVAQFRARMEKAEKAQQKKTRKKAKEASPIVVEKSRARKQAQELPVVTAVRGKAVAKEAPAVEAAMEMSAAGVPMPEAIAKSPEAQFTIEKSQQLLDEEAELKALVAEVERLAKDAGIQAPKLDIDTMRREGSWADAVEALARCAGKKVI